MRSLFKRLIALALVLCLLTLSGCQDILSGIDFLADLYGDCDADQSEDDTEGPQLPEIKEYQVLATEFEYTGFTLTEGETDVNTVTLTGKCAYSLISYSYEAVLYDLRGNVLQAVTGQLFDISEAGQTLSFEISVTDRLFERIDNVFVTFKGVSRDAQADSGETVAAVFVSGGEQYAVRTVSKGEAFPMPDDPERDASRFVGWYKDAYLDERYDGALADESITLYAAFETDVDEMTERVRQSLLPGVITVYCKCYNEETILGFRVETGSVTSQGSGVIFKIENGYCYALTNWHVAKQEDGYGKRKLTVRDTYGTEYSAELLSVDGKEVIESGYDLAVLRFKLKSRELLAVEFAEDDVHKGDFVAALGSPGNEFNTVTGGKVAGYSYVGEGSELKDIEFEVVKFDAYIAGGSSGGALVDHTMRLCGIVFAGNKANGITYGFAIPISRVRTFLDIYGVKY